MNIRFLAIVTALITFCTANWAQTNSLIDSVFVETYYVSDTTDEAFSDIDIMSLEPQSYTYRIFVDLVPGARLTKMYGGTNHALFWSSSRPFFNHIDRGQTYGYLMSKTHLNKNTVPLDSWLTLGLASTLHYGVPKAFDGDTLNLITNKRRDSLLRNNTVKVGIPLTQADGLAATDSSIGGFLAIGFPDSSVFNFNTLDTMFSSYEASLSLNANANPPGIQGPDTFTNRVLIAQLTTAGVIRFDLNLEIAAYNASLNKWETFQYVARNPGAGEDSSFWLSYPRPAPDCGCNDPRYAEFDLSAACFHPDSCINLIRLGCTDPAACNFDPEANYPRDGSYCCYNSDCAYNLELVCPGTVYGCTDPDAVNYNPLATDTSSIDVCYYLADAGCTLSAYREYNPAKRFLVEDSCRVLKITGCMDRTYCNYNPFANIHNPELCSNQSCDSADNASQLGVMVYPNPASSEVFLQIGNMDGSVLDIEISNAYGRRMEFIHSLTVPEGSMLRFSLDNYAKGVYLVKVSSDTSFHFTKFIKE